jgi:hypothetical protein
MVTDQKPFFFVILSFRGDAEYMRFFGLVAGFRDSYRRNFTNVANWLQVVMFLNSLQVKHAAFKAGLRREELKKFFSFGISNKITHKLLVVLLECISKNLVAIDKKELLKGLGREPSTVAMFEQTIRTMIRSGDVEIARLVIANIQPAAQKNIKIRNVCKKMAAELAL